MSRLYEDEEGKIHVKEQQEKALRDHAKMRTDQAKKEYRALDEQIAAEKMFEGGAQGNSVRPLATPLQSNPLLSTPVKTYQPQVAPLQGPPGDTNQANKPTLPNNP